MNTSKTTVRGADPRVKRRTTPAPPVDPTAARVRRRIDDILSASAIEALDVKNWFDDLAKELKCKT
jgi:hypothetical protein